MLKKINGGLGGLLCLALGACGAGDAPTAVEEVHVTPLDAANGANVVASASGGAQYTLEGVDFDGDGVPDPLPQHVSFTAQKSADGTVKGSIVYSQEFQGETFWLRSNVTCINVYDGNRAKYGGLVLDANFDIGEGVYMWLHSIDHGQGSGSPPDETTGIGIGDNAANEAFCDSPALPNPRFLTEITSGNIQVGD